MRLDEYLVIKKLVRSRSSANDLIRRGKVRVGTKFITKPAWKVKGDERVQVTEKDQYVSRAGHKLASVADDFKLNFKGIVVLDVGSSTGGFTEFALKRGANKVVAVDVGTNQMRPHLANDKRVELHEKTDIRTFSSSHTFNLIVADVSFISLTKVLPSLATMANKKTQLVMMAKPQFESEGFNLAAGVVKNSKQRKQILDRFELWLKTNGWVVRAKRDSGLAGAKGNIERFYLLSKQ